MSATAESPVDVASQWREDEIAARATVGAPGIIDREKMRTMSGLEVFAAIRRGELPAPPIGHLLGFVVIEFEQGRVVFQGTPRLEHYNPLGVVHGGYAATLLDSCVGCAVQTMLPAGKGYTTLELKVNFIRAMTDKTGPVRAEGKVISVGNQAGVAEGRLTDASGRLLAFATTTCLIFPI
ncbi:MAG: PaaI family thioesterase [Burkholderiaceae bacterium]